MLNLKANLVNFKTITMKLAFSLYHYFPYGGLQRDFIQFVQACSQLGHEIHVWTTHWEGPEPDNVTLHLIKPSGLQNHTRLRRFARTASTEIKQNNMDASIGFNKIPGLDIYFAADTCLRDRTKQRAWVHHWLPRTRCHHRMESEVFTSPHCDIIYISPSEKTKYQYYYQTPEHQLHWLSPGLSLDRQYPDNADTIRAQIRAE